MQVNEKMILFLRILILIGISYYLLLLSFFVVIFAPK